MKPFRSSVTLALMIDAKTRLGDQTFVAFDTETTGTGAGTRVIEIAGVRFRGGELLDRFESLIDPEIPIPPDSIAVHQIDEAMVKGQKKAPQVLAQFFEFAGDAVLVAHNASFDAGMVGLELTRHRQPAPDNAILDSLRSARRMFPAGAHSLDALIDLLGLPAPEQRHRAIGDAELVVHLMFRMIESLGGPEVKLGKLLEQSGDPLAFQDHVLAAPSLPYGVQLLEKACRDRTKVNLHLDTGGSRTQQRIVTPQVYYDWNGSGYLEAFCPEEGHSRCFRLDKVSKAEPGASSGFLF